MSFLLRLYSYVIGQGGISIWCSCQPEEIVRVFIATILFRHPPLAPFPYQAGIAPALLNLSNAPNHPSGSLSSQNPTPLAFSKFICRSNVQGIGLEHRAALATAVLLQNALMLLDILARLKHLRLIIGRGAGAFEAKVGRSALRHARGDSGVGDIEELIAGF